MTEEMLDLVDEKDQTIGKLSREEIYKKGLGNYRVIHGLLVNAEGKIWIPRRTGQKKIFPNALDYSVAGHVESGETYDETFRRETAEELNLDINALAWKQLGKLTPADGAHCFQMIYEIRSDNAPNFNREDFSEAQWMTPQEVIARIEGGESAKNDLAMTIKKFFL